MADLNKKILLIAIFLIAIPLFSGASPIRIIKVKLALDENSPYVDSARKRMEKTILTVSRQFEREFGLKFIVTEVSYWQSEKELESFHELFLDLQNKVDRGENHIVIGFTARKLIWGELRGSASYISGYLLIRWEDVRQNLTYLLTHELGHLFGAVHTKNPYSVMNEKPAANRFGKENASLIKLNRQRGFSPHLFPIDGHQLKEALNHYKRLSKKRDYNSLDTHLFLILILMEVEQYSEIIERCQRLLKKEPWSVSTRNLMAVALRRSGYIDRAIEEYNRIIEMDPIYHEAYFNLGNIYFDVNRFNEAVKNYQEALKLKPNDLQAHLNLGLTYHRMNQPEQAKEEFSYLLIHYPDYEPAYVKLFAIYFKERNFEEAERICRKALDYEFNKSLFYRYLGMVLVELGKGEEAERYYRAALDLDPLCASTHLNLGNLYFNDKLLEKASLHYLKALEIDDQLGEAYYNLAVVYFNLEKYQLAWEHLQRAEQAGAKIHPDFVKQLKSKLDSK